jgi:hypothetical protein
VTPVSDPNASVAGDIVYLVVLKNGQVRDQLAYTIGERGTVRRLDFGAVDTDNDQLPDGWEQLYFMNTDATATADPDNDGWNNLREFREGTNPLRADSRHPADINPADNRITIAELAEYYAAWKAARAWPTAPTNIPQAYVTRASYIWEGGEYYRFSTNYVYPADYDGSAAWWAAAQPLWWVNVPAPTPHSVDGEGRRGQVSKMGTGTASERPMSVEAILPTRLDAGQPVRVVNRVTIRPGLRAYTVEAFLPAGWTLGETSDGGAYNAVSRKIKWGPYFDRRSRDLTCKLFPPATPTGLVEITGRASYDGYYVEIDGPKAITSPLAPVLVALPGEGSGLLQWVLDGYPGRQYRLESSADLLRWATLTTGFAGPDGKLQFEDPASDGQPQRFYRAVVVE